MESSTHYLDCQAYAACHITNMMNIHDPYLDANKKRSLQMHSGVLRCVHLRSWRVDWLATGELLSNLIAGIGLTGPTSTYRRTCQKELHGKGRNKAIDQIRLFLVEGLAK